MKRVWILSFLMILIALLTACQTEVEMDLPQYEPKLIVEGYIENGKPAMVMLTKSLPYFEHIDLNYVLQNLLVLDAVVTVTSSDGESERLTLMPTAESPFYFAYVGNMLGKENTSYDLKIEYGGQVYSATTTISHTFDLDSIGFDHSMEILSDTSRTIRVAMTDNPAEVNYYQFMVKVHGKHLHDNQWITCIPVVFDDVTFSGQTINVEVMRANPSSFLMPEMNEEDAREYFRMTFRPGDTVFVKHCLIDYASYQFWMTGGSEAALGQNPFMNPSPVISNIKGENVAGVWCGYAAKTDVLIYEDETKVSR